MSKKLYVGNLAFGTTAADLEQLFGEYGTVNSAQIVTDRETGRSRGFAFVEMADGADADAAAQATNMTSFQGRNLTVNEAKPREDRPRSGGGRRRPGRVRQQSAVLTGDPVAGMNGPRRPAGSCERARATPGLAASHDGGVGGRSGGSAPWPVGVVLGLLWLHALRRRHPAHHPDRLHNPPDGGAAQAEEQKVVLEPRRSRCWNRSANRTSPTGTKIIAVATAQR